ncbi:MAG: sugar porter family MFS transporter [Endozoicomonas sp.]
MSNKQTHDISYVIRICMVAALGGLLFGYDTAVISGAVGPLREFFGLTDAMTGWAVSNVVVGCIFGSFFAGKISYAIGRKSTLMLAAGLFFVSALGSAVAPNFTLFVVFRMIGGLAVGLASVISPMYMSEVAPKDYRGRTVSMHQQSAVIGQTLVFFVNFLIAKGATETWLVDMGWRMMLGSEVIPAVLFGGLLLIIPESPRWCVLRGKEEEALKILSRISNPEHAKGVLKEIKESIESAPAQKKASLLQSGLMPIVVIGCLIASMQQIIGINVIMYYTPEILKPIAGGTETALLQTIVIGVVFIFGNSLGMYMIDRSGRLPLLKVGSIGCFIGMLMASYGIYTQSEGYTALIGLVVYVVSFAISWGCCCWTLIAEVFPNRIRSQAMAFAVACQWTTGFVVTQTFPMINGNAYLMDKYNGAFSFWVFSIFCLVAYWFVVRFVPETKGVSLEKMEEHFMSRHSQSKASDSEPVLN